MTDRSVNTSLAVCSKYVFDIDTHETSQCSPNEDKCGYASQIVSVQYMRFLKDYSSVLCYEAYPDNGHYRSSLRAMDNAGQR